MLTHFLSAHTWPYHTKENYTLEEARQLLSGGKYLHRSGVKTFFINFFNNEIDGYIRVFDLGANTESDETPLFDLRLKAQVRGNGMGTKAVQWLTDWVFANYPKKSRIEATSRADNIAMQKVLMKNGFAKEAHYRQSWKAADGQVFDCAGFSILKSDREQGTLTPVRF